jgi:single-strand DNA-binding protein
MINRGYICTIKNNIMEKSLNKVELRGHVGQDPKIMTLDNGSQLTRFTLATNENYRTRDNEWKEETMWHNIAAWSSKSMPEFERIKKGMFIELVGKIRYVKYKSKEGDDRVFTEIMALKIVVPVISQKE